MIFDELMQTLTDGGPRLVSSLAQLLLEYCRTHAASVRADLADLHRADLFSKHRRRMHNFFDELGEEELEGADIEQLVKTMRVLAQGTSEHLSVRATVEALDSALAPLIVGSFRGKHSRLDDLKLIPYPKLSLKHVLAGAHLSTRPETTEPNIDCVKSFGLPPADLAGVEVYMDWRLEDALAPLKHEPSLSIGDPGTRLSDMRMERYRVGDSDVFYAVRPLDVAEHRKRVLKLVEAAQSRSCHVLVLPELSVDEETLDVIRKQTERPLVVVAGSRHNPADKRGPGENIAVFFVGREERSHLKFRPFDFAEKVGTGSIRVTEHLQPRNSSFAVYLSHSWSFCVLICKDFLSEEVQRLLVALHVRLVLVPALTMETEDFRVGIERIALHGQALSVMANEPTIGSFFGHPIRGNLAELSLGEPGKPTLHVLDIHGTVARYLTDA